MPRLSILLLLAALGCVSPQDRGAPAIVSAATPEAAAAGIEVLRAGGNAADAAVAVSLALGVSEPAGSGIGGQVFLLVCSPEQGAFVIHGSTRAPMGVPAGVTAAEVSGRRACAVPSALAVLDTAHRRFGSGRQSWAELCRPAIELCQNGYRQGRFRAASTARYRQTLSRDPAARRELLDAAGNAPPPGAVIRRPKLARTLERIAVAGAADFYRGGIAEEIAADMAANGGWITAEDLASFPQPAVVAPLHSRWRGYDVYSLPPPAGGWVVLAALQLLQRLQGDAGVPRDSGDDHRSTLALVRALQLALGERARAPIGGRPDGFDLAAGRTTPEYAASLLEREGAGETTHFVVADAEGMVVCGTQSINSYFGCGVMHPSLGFLYNDYLRELEVRADDHPFALRPGALPLSSMAATVLVRDGHVQLALGSPGSARIISAVVQVIRNWAVLGMDLQAAVAAPRLHVVPGTRRVRLERLPGAELALALAMAGYALDVPVHTTMSAMGNPYFGGVHALAWAGGGWQGAADPRRDGAVLAVSR